MAPRTKQEESKVLFEFKERIGDLLRPYHDDHTLRKWLKARCFDVDKAEVMFRNSMAYRDKMKVDSILEDYKQPEVIQKYLTGGFCGHDKEGTPIRIELFGLLDMKGLMYSTRKSDLEKTKLHQCESTLRDWKLQSNKLGRRIDGLTVIFDMDKVSTKSLWRPGLQMYLHIVKVMEDNYPEMMKQMFVVNAPKIFPILWKICRPLISEDMKAKIHVLGADYQEQLLKYIDEEQLPVFLGGTRKDPDGDPRCASLICQGGEVPRSYYSAENTITDIMETATIAKGEKMIIDFQVEKADSILRWEFRTDDFDVAFGVQYTYPNGTVKDVLPVRRYNAHQVTEDDSLVCTNTGTYAIVFDNSYSWTKAKCLHYLVELHTCDGFDQDLDDVSTGGSWTRLAKDMQVTKL
ncbi:hypothetical protein CAPTEDRAFT_152329 [Capitella teleta]|uniref:CRAL-TRIO domain-containing protein n=1 Tax=Capitella teleta TaxID=283909 RepID=R7UNY1_CAPTE|nr:hypothetical protein CAPTEDRAFT_152329 [Capitella teleta]|eukprot:ELU07823.1 hypothetical protein CAPTEDRAFT_152329 [Capitella teleta]